MLEARKCPQCNEKYLPPIQSCAKDGLALEVTNTLIGQTLDRYRIDSVLGVGGMGAVYRATHTLMESEFAVKVLHPELVETEGAIERFRREAIAAQRIRHENAVEVTDFGVTAEKLVYLVMRIVEGRSLHDLIREQLFDYRRAVEILCQVCAAIHKAHQKNIIHRDLKPDNIFVQKVGIEERVKVLDFGIAKMLEPERGVNSQQVLTKPGLIIGTPQYMSPEQCQGRELDPRSDIYSLGTIAYEMLCGRRPFLAQHEIEYLSKHLRETTPLLSQFFPNIPPSIERVVMRALEKDPENRFSSAEEFAKELRNAAREAESRPTNPPPTKPDGLDLSSQQTTPLTNQTKRLSPDLPIQETRKFTTTVKSKPPAIKILAGIIALAIGGGIYFALSGNGSNQLQMRSIVDSTNQAASIKNECGEMMPIAGGKFIMGYNGGDEDEQPEHEVEVKPYCLDKLEVTNQQYKKFVEATNRRSPTHWKNGTYLPEEALLPVTYVTWLDAVEYAKWSGKRLPTEAEWEFAARNGKKHFLFPWGNEWKEGIANVFRGDETDKPSPVQSFEKDVNDYGVFDLAGNVSEWVQDTFRYYDKSKKTQIPAELKVYRGGNFIDEAKDSRATKRWSVFQDVPQEYAERVFPRVGFRCAKDTPSTSNDSSR